MNVPEGARELINKEAARKNNILQQRDEIMMEQVKKEYVPVKRNEHVISYVDVMRNFTSVDNIIAPGTASPGTTI